MSASILIVNLAVLLVVLESDLGTRKVSAFRIARPLLMALGIVLLFIEHPATAGPGEALELALAQPFDLILSDVVMPRRDGLTLLEDLNAKKYTAAAEQLLRWDHAGALENAGLKARREAEFHLWHSAVV